MYFFVNSFFSFAFSFISVVVGFTMSLVEIDTSQIFFKLMTNSFKWQHLIGVISSEKAYLCKWCALAWAGRCCSNGESAWDAVHVVWAGVCSVVPENGQIRRSVEEMPRNWSGQHLLPYYLRSLKWVFFLILNLNDPIWVFCSLRLLQVISWLHPFLGPLQTKSNARWGGYLCRWSSITE